MKQVIELVCSVLFCPLTQLLLCFADIHRDASVFAFSYFTPKRL